MGFYNLLVKNFLIVLIKIYNRCNKRCFKKRNSKEEATGDLIDNKIANKTTSSSKKVSQNNLEEANNEIDIPKERYISPQKRQQIVDELRLIW